MSMGTVAWPNLTWIAYSIGSCIYQLMLHHNREVPQAPLSDQFLVVDLTHMGLWLYLSWPISSPDLLCQALWPCQTILTLANGYNSSALFCLSPDLALMCIKMCCNLN